MMLPEENQEFVIRVATKSDIPVLTELHCASFRPQDHVPVMLGKDYVRATYEWLVGSEKSYCLVAESVGDVIGLIAVCDGSYTLSMFMACLPEFARSILRSPGLLLQRRLWDRLLRRPHTSKAGDLIANFPGIAQITIGAVDERWRGKGVFPSLVDATKSYSSERGSRAIRVGIYKSNQSSRRVFIKGDWVETPELETKDTVFYVYYIDPDLPTEIAVYAK